MISSILGDHIGHGVRDRDRMCSFTDALRFGRVSPMP